MEDYVQIVSGEGAEFFVPRRVALHSKMMKQKLEYKEKTVYCRDISAPVLEFILQFLHEKEIKGHALAQFEPLQQLDPTKAKNRQFVIEVLLAVDFLDC